MRQLRQDLRDEKAAHEDAVSAGRLQPAVGSAHAIMRAARERLWAQQIQQLPGARLPRLAHLRCVIGAAKPAPRMALGPAPQMRERRLALATAKSQLQGDNLQLAVDGR